MSEEEWEKFFELVEKIVNQKDMTYQEKRELVSEEAGLRGYDCDFGEMISWYGGDIEPILEDEE